MQDPRLTKLAHQLLTHSLTMKESETVLITGSINSKPLIKELIKASHDLNIIPHVEYTDDEISRLLLTNAKKEQFTVVNKWNLYKFKDIDGFIQIVGEENDAELVGVPQAQFRLAGEEMKASSDFLVDERKWVLLNYPTNGFAQKAKMSYDDFYNYYIDVCSIDYKKMENAQLALKDLMEQTDNVHITAPGTDLSFSIKDISAVMCAGEFNIPDGEVYTAPVKNTVNGTITYNTPCPYQGNVFHDVELTFKDGKIIAATSDKTDELNAILDTDDGARFIGEFAIGLNPKITEPMGDILFDEKIAGSLHFTPGAAYDDADNGNDSSVHWDMVLIQRHEYGGGKIYFDDVLIRDNGIFVLDELKALNPENLL
ncbi:aminopeptidase [Virgibacillus necropolis]|uniref:Aminopeptidase n=1 Tax=Virgibacillus necropolis TaxID=163877 RepID=A0A221MGV0_9BACI|nr:aminopeptidase [Virgibacillus necropolis]ASN06864.1 aminopeptidase [Virgibacillus necropolis]